MYTCNHKNNKFVVIVVDVFMVKVVFFDYDVAFIDFDSHVVLPPLFGVAFAGVGDDAGGWWLVAVSPNEHALFELVLL